MNKITHLFFVLFFLLTAYSLPSSAALWSWINTIETCKDNTYCFDYNYTIADWDEEDQSVNPCYGLRRCTIFISHRHNTAGTSGPGIDKSWSSDRYPFLVDQQTMGGVAKEFKKIFSLPYTSTTRHASGAEVKTQECVGIFIAPSRNLGSVNSPTNNSKYQGYSLMAGSICGAAPPPSGSCDFALPTITLDHGLLTRAELDGHEVSENVTINCTTPQALKLYIYAANNLRLRSDGSLSSQLYLNDTNLGTDGLLMTVKSESLVNIKSVLKTNGTVAAGEFSGSTVLLITIE